MKKCIAFLLMTAGVVGCSGPTEQAVETKPSEVHQNIPKEQQDRIAASFKTWTPDKKK